MGKRLSDLRRTALPMATAVVMLAGAFVAVSSTNAVAATSASRALAVSTNGEWPGLGKICESGPGGASSVRGVGPKTIHIAVFNDASNTIEPGLEIEFLQQAKAFATWCNASGGINGRDIVVDNRDAALFNAAQQTELACQSDFMAVGGGMALDQPAVPIREQCGLGQISGYVVSDASVNASLQVDPSGTSTKVQAAGWFGAMTKKYPQAVKKAGMGGANTPSVLESERKFEFAAEAEGWNVVDFQEPPVSVTDWAPYVEEAQTKGVQALWPSATANMTPYFQAMTTAAYKPAFIELGTQFYNATTTAAVAANPGIPPVYVETRMVAARDGIAEPLDGATRQRHAHLRQGLPGQLLRRGGGGVLALMGQVGLGLWRQPDGVVRPEPRRDTEELECRGHRGPGGATDHVQPESRALALLRDPPGGAEQVRLRQGGHPADPVHLELQPEEHRPPDVATAGGTDRGIERGRPYRGPGRLRRPRPRSSPP